VVGALHGMADDFTYLLICPYRFGINCGIYIPVVRCLSGASGLSREKTVRFAFNKEISPNAIRNAYSRA
jgi:hypothetical protein